MTGATKTTLQQLSVATDDAAVISDVATVTNATRPDCVITTTTSGESAASNANPKDDARGSYTTAVTNADTNATAMPRRQQNRLAREKRIIEASLKVFAQMGYSAAKMDAIAAEAGLSKPTLYQYFDSKEKLFTSMMQSRRDDMLLAFAEAPVEALVEGQALLPESSTINGQAGVFMVNQLHDFAWRYAETVLRPELLSLARLIIAETQRFPEIGRAYQEAGPDRVLDGVIDYLEKQRSAGRLEFEDSELAAQDLWGLILSAPRNQALHRPDNLPDQATVARYINNGLSVFLKAYSTDKDRDLKSLKILVSAIAASESKSPGNSKKLKQKNNRKTKKVKHETG